MEVCGSSQGGASTVSADLNHTIVRSRHKRKSAEFLANILSLEAGPDWGPFVPVITGNGVTLDYQDVPDDHISAQHYAFLVAEEDFDAAIARLREAEVTYYADPFLLEPGGVNHHDGGRGVYFVDPDGHVMELITRPYGREDGRPQTRPEDG
jgi:catechol 2,3-dioxygenase-like lactoylglutathione lyase family enzyme